MARNHLLGRLGDKIHALLCGCRFNLATLLRASVGHVRWVFQG